MINDKVKINFNVIISNRFLSRIGNESARKKMNEPLKDKKKQRTNLSFNFFQKKSIRILNQQLFIIFIMFSLDLE